MKTLNYSRQREALMKCLEGRRDHPTADVLFQSLWEEDPKISLATVYRNLNLLTNAGKIRKISCGDGTEHYDFVTDDHSHFICKECGKIIDLTMHPSSRTLRRYAENNEEISTIEGHSLILYGYCKTCQEKRKKTS